MKTLIVMCPSLSFLWAAMLQTRYVTLTRLIVTNLMRKGLSLSADAENEPQRLRRACLLFQRVRPLPLPPPEATSGPGLSLHGSVLLY